jgi:hypothetical protein
MRARSFANPWPQLRTANPPTPSVDGTTAQVAKRKYRHTGSRTTACRRRISNGTNSQTQAHRTAVAIPVGSIAGCRVLPPCDIGIHAT